MRTAVERIGTMHPLVAIGKAVTVGVSVLIARDTVALEPRKWDAADLRHLAEVEGVRRGGRRSRQHEIVDFSVALERQR